MFALQILIKYGIKKHTEFTKVALKLYNNCEKVFRHDALLG